MQWLQRYPEWKTGWFHVYNVHVVAPSSAADNTP